MSLRIVDAVGLSDVGRHRQANEDSYVVAPPLFAVADGMGGARAGEVASRLAVEALEADLAPDGSPEHRLREIVGVANRRIWDLSRSDAEHAGMGTTLTAAMVDGPDVVIGHVGDSRLYRLRGGGIERLTTDHSLVEELVRQGKLTPEGAERHPQKSIITRALGPEPEVEVETFTAPGRAGDVYLICSDGLTGMISEPHIAEILRDPASLEAAAHALVDAANENGGRDNITVVLFRLGEGDDRRAESDTLSGREDEDALRTEDLRAAVTEGSGRDTIVLSPEAARAARGEDGPAEEPGDRPVAPEAGAAPTQPGVDRPVAPEAGAAPTQPGVDRPVAPEAGAEPTKPGDRPAAPEGGAEPSQPAPTPSAEPAAPKARGRARRSPGRARRTARGVRRGLGAVVGLAVAGAVLVAAWQASRQVYFVGTDGTGLVTLYRGLPFDGPFGLSLYEPVAVSSVPAASIAPPRRARILDHELRSRDDAADLVAQLEQGRIP